MKLIVVYRRGGDCTNAVTHAPKWGSDIALCGRSLPPTHDGRIKPVQGRTQDISCRGCLRALNGYVEQDGVLRVRRGWRCG